MKFTPQDLLEWYKKRPVWFKIIFSIFFVVVIVLVALWWFLGQSIGLGIISKKGALETIVESSEEKYKKDSDGEKERIKKTKKEIEKLDEELKKLDELKKKGMKKNAKEHKKIDSVGYDASSIVDVINKNRRKRKY